LNDEKGREVYFHGQREDKPYSLIYAMKISYCVKGVLGTGVMLWIFKRQKDSEDILMAYEFKDVFPEELPGFPP